MILYSLFSVAALSAILIMKILSLSGISY